MEGVANIIDSKYANTLLKWKLINEGIIYAWLNATHINLSTIDAHADELDKHSSYYSMQVTVDNVPRHEVLLLPADINAIV